jgi:hypothetical protein
VIMAMLVLPAPVGAHTRRFSLLHKHIQHKAGTITTIHLGVSFSMLIYSTALCRPTCRKTHHSGQTLDLLFCIHAVIPARLMLTPVLVPLRLPSYHKLQPSL